MNETQNGKIAFLPRKADEQRRRLRIVHMVSSLKVGGMEQVVVRLASAQQRVGHEVLIIALGNGPLIETAASLGLRVRLLAGGHKLTRVPRGALTMRRFRPDIVHAHNPSSLHYAVIGRLVGGARVIMTDHAATKGARRIPGRLERRLTDAVVAVSHDTARKAVTYGRVVPMTVIHNGIDLAAADGSREELRTKLGLPEGFVGIMVASLERVKGHADLLRALALLHEEQTPTTMLIVGGGPERDPVEQMARDLQLGAEWVRFLGIRSDVGDLLAAADFFVLPSMLEGLPIAILEAMARGLPVIATPVGGVPELIEDGKHGLLVHPNDPLALAQAIRRLADDTELRVRLGETAARHVREEFSFAGMAGKYEELYYSLLACARPSTPLGTANVAMRG